MDDTSCRGWNSGTRCPAAVTSTKPVPLCQTHRLEITIGVLAEGWMAEPAPNPVTVAGRPVPEMDILPPPPTCAVKLGPRQARGLLLDSIVEMAEHGIDTFCPKDLTHLLPRLTRSRPWLVGELQRLTAVGYLRQKEFGEYLITTDSTSSTD